MFMRLVGAALGLLLLGPAAAGASSYDDFNAGIAFRNHGEDADAIVYLTRALAASDLPAHLREPALLARAIAYENQKNLAAANADCTAAIALAPRLVSTYVIRAVIEGELKKNDAALADYARAIALKPFEASLYFGRAGTYEDTGRYAEAEADFAFGLKYYPEFSAGVFGLALMQWAQGRFDKALPNFERARDIAPDFVYFALWREVGRVAAGVGDSTLKRDTQKFDSTKWPAPVIGLFLAKQKPDDVLAAAEKGDAKAIDGQRCEAQFYVAEWHLEQKDSVAVEPLLTLAASNACPEGFVEKMAASVELARMKTARVKP